MKKFIFLLSSKKGFTLVELIVIMGIVFTLTGIIAINLVNQVNITSAGATIDTLISDMNTQQTKSMSGNDIYSIYFQPDKYTLFKGINYSSNNPTNLDVSIEKSLIISNIKFPSNTIIYAIRSGEVSNFSAGNNSVTVKSVSGTEAKTLTINKYGVIIGVN